MAVNYLHIWPRQTFMLIALPNQVPVLTIFFEMRKLLSRVGAAHKVSRNWSLEKMTCHSSNNWKNDMSIIVLVSFGVRETH